MEWSLEGVTLIFAGTLTAAISLAGDDGSITATVACVATAALLIVMAVISLLTRPGSTRRGARAAMGPGVSIRSSNLFAEILLFCKVR
jgi:hypothetical protein